ncbi:MAG: hypothetical protein J0I41_03945 [Filimonas sp.]|nr:hypothetical protein [Filimonas sp.]
MFNLFSGNKNKQQSEELSSMQQELAAIEQRWYTFLSKLEEKYDEVLTAFEAEAPSIYEQDEDYAKRTYHRFKSGMDGQLTAIRKKMQDTAEVQIRNTYRKYDTASYNSPYEWRNRCLDAEHQWEERTNAKRDAAFAKVEQAVSEDLEVQYANILATYEQIKNKFTCTQCGCKLTIDRLYFISTYITCPACNTQNTFEPGTQIRTLEWLARPLAEHRTKHLYEQYQQHVYNGRHDDRVAYRQGKEAESMYYEKYLRAMFDEMNNIIPDKREQNELFYQRMLADHKR